MRTKTFAKVLVCLLSLCCLAGDKRAMTFEDMFTMQRISNLSLHGTRVLYRVRTADLETNGYHSNIYMLDLNSGESHLMVPGGTSPTWHPNGKAFAYGKNGQIFIKTLDGRADRQVTNAKGGASGARFSPDGNHLLFVSSVPVIGPKDHSGKLIESLFFRQWNRWVDEARDHVFVVESDATMAPGRDMTPGNADSPPLDLGSSHDYCFSPDNQEIAFVKNPDKVVAISTNNDIFTVSLTGGQEHQITTSKGRDAEPHYSPDGKYIAYVAMERPGFEADRHEIIIYDRNKKTHRKLKQEDHSADNLIWAPDSKSIYYNARVKGALSIFNLTLKGKTKRLTETYYDKNLQLSADGNQLVFTREATHMPAEIFIMDLKTQKITQKTFLNQDALVQLDMKPWEDFWFKSPNGADVQGFIIKPPSFDPNKKYPMTYLIHGGPQGMWSNNFHYRWNSQMFAAPGHVVILVNPHGSKGYGQKFCDAVSRDWGGLPYGDLKKGIDEALKRFPFIDKNRLGAAGASYGGYMINWFATHENPFKALVSHNGVFNMPSMAGTTEELWFTEWEFGGTYYENPELYEKWSPHRRANNLKTPTLVIHSELDYRVPLNQGIELFSALQRQGIPSKWLYFPDEDHFVSKPHNARMWWRTVLDWLAEYTAP